MCTSWGEGQGGHTPARHTSACVPCFIPRPHISALLLFLPPHLTLPLQPWITTPTAHCCSEKLDVLDHYVAWRQTHDMPQHSTSGSDGPFSFCSYPFLLNPRAKSKLLHTEARIQMDQTVAQSRLEQQASSGSSSARGARRAEEDECVVPNEKARISAMLRGNGDAHAAAGGAASNSASGRGAHGSTGGRRRDRQGGLRWLFNSLRTSDGPAQQHAPAAGASSVQDDERRMMGRQINGTSDGTGPPSLWKQGSLNLPAPEESGFPAVHPDMCILRIRRNHLLEVRRGQQLLLGRGQAEPFLQESGLVCGAVGVGGEKAGRRAPEVMSWLRCLCPLACSVHSGCT